ncbi:MAG: CAP domain-containing protein [Bacteroidetes bacterium]|nr:MAG: CAP domain-containing protein [Bacteroidota bacterium]
MQLPRYLHFVIAILPVLLLISSCSKDDNEPGIPVIKLELLELVNEVRSRGYNCNGTDFSPVEPLKWNIKLHKAAQLHAEDMSVNSYFSHNSADGRTPQNRISEQDYNWRAFGENIAYGFNSAQGVMNAWLSSEGHCRNIMKREFSEIGIGYAENGHYWVQVFGHPK